MPTIDTGIKTEEVLGLRMVSCTSDEFVTVLGRRLASGKAMTIIFPVPVNLIIRSKRDTGFRAVLDKATFLLPDGMPVLWVGRFFGRHIAEKISGSDLFPRICRLASEQGYSVFFLGGRPGSAKQSAKLLKERYPSLDIVGVHSPPFGFETSIIEEKRAVDFIRMTRPDILFVGLGSPKQERWIWENRYRVGVPLVMAVGGSFELFSGAVRRAPVWFQKSGFEWLWRVMMELRRLWWRYASDGFMLLYYVVAEAMKRLIEDLRIGSPLFLLKVSQSSIRAMRVMRHPARFTNLLKLYLVPQAERVHCKPRHMVFYVTDKCNLKCGWCLANTQASRFPKHCAPADLDLAMFKKILGKCPTIEAISFTGQGEPLMNRDLPAMMRYATRMDLSIFLTTNGILLDSAMAGNILSANVLRVNLSLKGMNEREFAGVTGEGGELFRRQLDNTRLLVAARNARRKLMAIRLSYVIGRRNFRNMETVIALADALGADELLFDNVIPYADMGDDRDRFFEDDGEMIGYIEALKSVQRRVKVIYPVLLRRESFGFYCPGYYEILDVDAEGNISGCMRVLTPERSFGNIMKDKDYMNTNHFCQTRKMFLGGTLPKRCRYCVEMSC